MIYCVKPRNPPFLTFTIILLRIWCQGLLFWGELAGGVRWPSSTLTSHALSKTGLENFPLVEVHFHFPLLSPWVSCSLSGSNAPQNSVGTSNYSVAYESVAQEFGQR